MELSGQLIEAFYVVVEEGTVRAAAQRLGRTQPAITARIQQLEDLLGVPLFNRVGRRLELTPLGRRAFDRARDVMHATLAFEDEVKAAVDEPTGVLRIGALPTVSSFRLAPVVAHLTATHARLQIELVLGPVEPALAGLRAGRLDAVFSVGEPIATDLDQRVIETIRPVGVFLADQAPRVRTVTARTLLDRPYIAPGQALAGDPFFDEVAGYIRRHRLDARSQIRVPHIQSIKELILAGAGYSILPDYTVDHPSLQAIPLRDLPRTLPLVLSTNPATRTLPNTRRLLDLLERQTV